MPNEPERDIEKLLKACAQKRRDEAGAPLELHPAARRMLLAEVARRTAKAPRGENVFVRMLTELRPRLAFGAAILAVLAGATWALLPSLDRTKGSVQMARRDAASPTKPGQSAGQDVAAAPSEMSAAVPAAEAPALASDSAHVENQTISEPASFAAAGAGAAAEQTALQETRKRNLLEADSLREAEVAAAPPAAAARQADLKRQVAHSSFSPTAPVRVTQKFAHVDSQLRTTLAAKAVNSVATEGILISFQITQAGDQMQVIDNDGSIYAGFIRPAPTPAAQPAPDAPQKTRGVLLADGVQSAKEEERPPAMAADKPAAPRNLTYFFQVEGTNSTLKQRVVFTGNLLVDSDALSAMQSKADSNQRSAFQFQQNAPTAPELQNSRITGQAIIGNGRTLQINAASVSP